MNQQQRFWADMPTNIRLRMGIGALYLIASGLLFTVNPLIGISTLMLPILWTVFVIWIGSESGLSFGPHSRARETASGYLVRYLWRASRPMKFGVVVLGTCLVLGGLVWISTEGLRVKEAEQTLTGRAADLADRAAVSTKETASRWYEGAKGWFTFGEDSD
ncbi:MAG: hypothetical protein AAFY31_01745 [Pseudomonadota bacterium]